MDQEDISCCDDISIYGLWSFLWRVISIYALLCSKIGIFCDVRRSWPIRCLTTCVSCPRIVYKTSCFDITHVFCFMGPFFWLFAIDCSRFGWKEHYNKCVTKDSTCGVWTLIVTVTFFVWLTYFHVCVCVGTCVFHWIWIGCMYLWPGKNLLLSCSFLFLCFLILHTFI